MRTRSTAAGCRGLLLTLAVIAAPALAGPIALAPMHAGQFQAGKGVDATFLKVDDAWRSSGVLYDADTDQFGTGLPIGHFRNGTGLWGLVDWRTAHSSSPPPGMIEASWSGRVAEIAYADLQYEAVYPSIWGAMSLVPLFVGDDKSSQENWSSRFTGFIRITEAGIYNFGVLHDDGFTFTLGGAGGQSHSLSHDYLNPPSRMAFDQDLLLDVGLYSFELGAYERLEVGVVELAWKSGDGEWSRVPMANLVADADMQSVPEPASYALLLGGLSALAAMRRRGKA